MQNSQANSKKKIHKSSLESRQSNFFLLGEGGRGSPRRRELLGDIGFLLKIPGGLPGREGPRGREGVCGELENFWGGGGYFFFSRPKCPPRSITKMRARQSLAGTVSALAVGPTLYCHPGRHANVVHVYASFKEFGGRTSNSNFTILIRKIPTPITIELYKTKVPPPPTQTRLLWVTWAHDLLKGAIITDSQKIHEIIPRRKTHNSRKKILYIYIYMH